MSLSGRLVAALFGLCHLAAVAHAGDCADPMVQVRSAQSDVSSFFLADAENGLIEAVRAFACAPMADPQQVAVLLRVMGTIRTFQEDEARALAAFRTAQQLAPDTWSAEDSDDARSLFDTATAASPESATLILKGDLGDWIAIDGSTTTPTASVTAGLHLVQVGRGNLAHFAQLIQVNPGESVVLTATGARSQNPPTPRQGGVWWQLAGGLSAAKGTGLIVQQAGSTMREPNTTLAMLVETSAGLSAGPIWTGGALGLAPLIHGQYLYAQDATDWRGTPVSLTARLDLGVQAQGVRVGVGSGISWPGRVPLSVVSSLPIGTFGWTLAPRFGVNLATARPAEPTAAVLLSWRSR